MCGNLLVVGRGDSVRGLKLSDGKERWRFPVSGTASAAIAERKGTLYLEDSKSTIYAMDVGEAKQRWRRKQNAGEKEPFFISAMTGARQDARCSGAALLRPRHSTPATDRPCGGSPWQAAHRTRTRGAVVASATGVVLVTAADSLYALPVD
ncbi:outer membrane protein assembly factor BamB family protein [Streptomyces sp. 8N114]|uniref:outer membrane protein assembly factor BamB family protein n=1 Tax=Streptomyces sp. 8N114 TaxID=3457419 RepID=UPI003FD31826